MLTFPSALRCGREFRVLLLEGGADHTLAGEGCTPMQAAVEYGHTACIELLEVSRQTRTMCMKYMST